MSNYNYLKIDFYGQFNDDTIHKLTYPEPFNPMDASSLLWLNPITDPRAIRTLFPMAKYGYKIHRDANGAYYSLLTRYERDARQGYVAITVMIGAQYESVINGKAIFNLLNLLKTNVLDTDNITATAVEHCLIACQMPTLNVAPLSITQVQNRSQQAFRVYNSNEELYDIFQFPKQSEYDQYGEVFLINKFWCNNSVQGLALLTSPIIKTYNVIKSSNVTCDSTTQTGNALNITYNKAGFAPLTIPVTINGIDNQYLRYEDANITILTPEDLPFKQRMNVKVRVNGYTYNDNLVRASVAGKPMHYSAELEAYTANVTTETLSEADIKVSVNIDDPLLDPTGKSQRRAAITKWLIPILSFILGAAIAGSVTWLFMKDKGSTDTTEQNPATIVNDSKTIINENFDIKYMNENQVWQLDSLKSPRFKNFATAISNGDVQEFMKGIESLKKDKKPVNPVLESIAEKIKQNPETAKEVLKNSDNKTIDLERISNELSSKINKAVEAQPGGGEERLSDVNASGNNVSGEAQRVSRSGRLDIPFKHQ